MEHSSWSSTPDTSLDLLNLPEEIWSKIFAYLPLWDRKCVRLTCQHFYEACNDIDSQNSEVIAFYGNVDDYFIESRLVSRRRSINLKLSGMQLTDNSILEFFENHGQYVSSLTVENCKLASGILKNMIKNCVNVRQIALLFDVSIKDCESYENIFRDFVALRAEKYVCGHVTEFTLKLPNRPNCCLTNCKFLTFFDVFPAIKSLNLTLEIEQDFDEVSLNSSHIFSDTKFSFPSVYHQLHKMRNRLEKLTLYLEYSSTRSHLSVETLTKISEIEMNNLKELSLNWIDLWDDSIKNSCTAFQHLTQIHCTIRHKLVWHFANFIKVLLNTAAKLHSLTIFSDCESIAIDSDCFRDLVKSNLVTLSLLCGGIRAYENMELYHLHDPLEPNNTVENLNLYHTSVDTWSLFTKYFLNLRRLHLPQLSDSILQNVFEYQKKLCSLELVNQFNSKWIGSQLYHDHLHKWVVFGSLPACRQLEYLTDLCIEDRSEPSKPLYFTDDFILSEFQFPNLKSLSIRLKCHGLYIDQDAVEAKIPHIVQKVDCLHHLKLHFPFVTSFQLWLSLVHSLRKLLSLCVTDDSRSPFSKSEYGLLFKTCSSLQTLCHNELKYFG